MDRVRIGLIGAGVMGHIHARSLASDVDRAALVAVADLDQGKASGCAEEFGASGAYAGYREILSDSSIDAVVICTPSTTHAEIIEAAANAGKHIFCEKPIDWDLAAVDARAGGGRTGGREAPDRVPAAVRPRVPAGPRRRGIGGGRASAHRAPDES